MFKCGHSTPLLCRDTTKTGELAVRRSPWKSFGTIDLFPAVTQVLWELWVRKWSIFLWNNNPKENTNIKAGSTLRLNTGCAHVYTLVCRQGAYISLIITGDLGLGLFAQTWCCNGGFSLCPTYHPILILWIISNVTSCLHIDNKLKQNSPPKSCVPMPHSSPP